MPIIWFLSQVLRLHGMISQVHSLPVLGDSITCMLCFLLIKQCQWHLAHSTWPPWTLPKPVSPAIGTTKPTHRTHTTFSRAVRFTHRSRPGPTNPPRTTHVLESWEGKFRACFLWEILSIKVRTWEGLLQSGEPCASCGRPSP